MVTSSFRMVPMQALASRIPGPSERARFMSIQSCVQHLASSAGATLSSRVLSARPDGSLVGVESLASLTALMTALLPLVLLAVEKRVRSGESAKPASTPMEQREAVVSADVSS
jgi:hypothetical protein